MEDFNLATDLGICRFRLRGQIDERELVFVLRTGESLLGSRPDSDVMLAAIGVSRQHARLSCHGKSLEIEDLGSRNGTFLNGERVGRHVLRDGDQIRLGPVGLRVEEIDAEDVALGLELEPETPMVVPILPLLHEHSTPRMIRLPRQVRRELHGELIFPRGHVPGRSPAMGTLYGELRPLTASALPVLIEGETGVGKEAVARTLHLSSPRRHRAFVALNCAAIPEDLLEAELFGIDEGVATGVRKRHGKFLAAQGGTLFLDEVAELSLEAQAKLLRALQEREIQPVGGDVVSVDVRVVAATNLDLLARVEEGRFRRDLYYRVAGFVLHVPTLRERTADLPLLVEHFLRRAAGRLGKVIRGVSVKAMRILETSTWPGNVRELEHEVERLALLCPDGQVIDSAMLAKRLGGRRPDTEEVTASDVLRLDEQVRAVERKAIAQALEAAKGSQRKAAKILGISRTTLAAKIRKLGIEG